MASPGTSMRDMTAHVERSESQILEEEVARLEVRAGPLRHRRNQLQRAPGERDGTRWQPTVAHSSRR